MKQRVFSFAACASVTASAVLHIRSIAVVLSNNQDFEASITLYFVLALVLDLGMLYVLLHNLNLKDHFYLKGKS